MQNIAIIFHNSVPCFGVNEMSPRLSIPSREPEHAAASDDRHLPHGRHRRVPAQHAQRAPVEFSLQKHEIERHQKAELIQVGRAVDPLRAPHDLGAHVGAGGEGVVDHHHHAEAGGGGVGGGGLGHNNGGGVAAADDVVEVEVEVA